MPRFSFVFMIVAFALCFTGVEAGLYCTSSYNYQYPKYCSYGCCGSYPDEYCCSNYVGVSVGAVFGVIFLIFIIVAIVFCCIKANGRSRRVVHPVSQPQPHVTAVCSGERPEPSYGMQPVRMQPGPQPPPYKPMTQPPPAYHYSNPAYPPGASNPAGTGGDPFNPPPPVFNTAMPPYSPSAPHRAHIVTGERPGPAYGIEPMGAQPVPQPPPYKPMTQPPPAYHYSDPAYPPGATPGASNPAGTGGDPFNPPPPGFNTAMPPCTPSAPPPPQNTAMP